MAADERPTDEKKSRRRRGEGVRGRRGEGSIYQKYDVTQDFLRLYHEMQEEGIVVTPSKQEEMR